MFSPMNFLIGLRIDVANFNNIALDDASYEHDRLLFAIGIGRQSALADSINRRITERDFQAVSRELDNLEATVERVYQRIAPPQNQELLLLRYAAQQNLLNRASPDNEIIEEEDENGDTSEAESAEGMNDEEEPVPIEEMNDEEEPVPVEEENQDQEDVNPFAPPEDVEFFYNVQDRSPPAPPAA